MSNQPPLVIALGITADSVVRTELPVDGSTDIGAISDMPIIHPVDAIICSSRHYINKALRRVLGILARRYPHATIYIVGTDKRLRQQPIVSDKIIVTDT